MGNRGVTTLEKICKEAGIDTIEEDPSLVKPILSK